MALSFSQYPFLAELGLGEDNAVSFRFALRKKKVRAFSRAFFPSHAHLCPPTLAP